MGQGAAVNPTLPPLPQGATLNAPPPTPSASALPPLPAGATLNTPSAPPQADPTPHWYDSLVDTASDLAAGVKKGLNETGESAMQILSGAGAPALGINNPIAPALQASTGWQKSLEQTHEQAEAPADTFSKKTGYAIENIIEFAAGDEALKGLSLGEKLTKLAPLVKYLEKFPRIAQALHAGIQAGTVTSAQSLVHGSTPDEALKEGAIGGVGGGVIHGVGGKIIDAIRGISPTVEDLGGTKITRLASQNDHATTAQHLAATAEHSPKVIQGQQAAANEVVENAAKGAAEQHLGELNEGRNAPPADATVTPRPYKFTIAGTGAEESSEGTIAHQAKRGRQMGNRSVEGKGPSERQVWTDPASGEPQQVYINNGDPQAPGSHRSPTYQMTEQSHTGSVARHDLVGGGADLVTEDPTIVKAHIANLNEAIDAAAPEERAALESQRAELQRQMGEYHAQNRGVGSPYRNAPRFGQIDVPKAVSRVRSYGEAADEIESGAKEVYNRLDDLTGGRFSTLREENKRAWNAVTNGGGDAAEARLAESQRKLNAMLSGTDSEVGDAVNHEDLAFANEAFKKAQILRSVHSKIESAFDTALGSSDTANSYRGFNGNRLRGAIKELVNEHGNGTLERVIGRDHLDNLKRLADITRTNADRAKFGRGVNHVAQAMIRNEGKIASGVGAAGAFVGHHLGGGYAGAAAGAATAEAMYTATRMVMRSVATNPKVGAQLAYAIQYGARPQNYAPLIGSMIRENAQEERQANQQ